MSWPAGANPFEINKGIFQLMTGIKLKNLVMAQSQERASDLL
jgi:hypothetical protein